MGGVIKSKCATIKDYKVVAESREKIKKYSLK
jgi:hypothetical protein